MILEPRVGTQAFQNRGPSSYVQTDPYQDGLLYPIPPKKALYRVDYGDYRAQ